MTEPRGVLAILTDGAGHVVATATDFEGSNQDAQRLRAESHLAIALVRALCHPDILLALRADQARDLIMIKLCRDHGYRVTWRAIGYDDEAAA